MMSNVFIGSEREEFFKNSGLPLWDVVVEVDGKVKTKPYALYTCFKEDQSKILKLQKSSQDIAKVYDRVSNLLRNSSDQTLFNLGFDQQQLELRSLNWGDFFSLRASWAWNNGELKLFEINIQDPCFWVEPELISRTVCKKFGMKDTSNGSLQYLKSSLNEAIQKALKEASIKKVNPHIGFVCINSDDDLMTNNFYSSYCNYSYEVVPSDKLDFSEVGDVPYSLKSGKSFDLLVVWYPLEWFQEQFFPNGESVWDVFVNCVKERKCAVVQAIPAFFLKSKAIFAFIWENKETIFQGELKEYEKYFPKTYFESTKLGESYFAKPIWGVYGKGCYLVQNGQRIDSRLQEEWYVKQKKVYQELLRFPQVLIEGRKLNLIYEVWVYRVGEEFKAGSVGVRADEHLITDANSYWLPIGC